MYYSEATKYNDIFKDCYWGRFRVSENNAQGDPMFEARNKFVEDFSIKCASNIKNRPSELSNSGIFDHVEIYRTFDNKIIFVTSPYENKDEEAKKYEMTPYLCIYGKNSNTYLKAFSSLKEYNLWVKSNYFRIH